MFRVGAIYAIVAWVLTQIIVAVEAPLSLPPWMDTGVILFLALGFPVALTLAYAFEVTPEGVARTSREGESGGQGSNRSYAALVLASGIVVALLYVWGYSGLSSLQSDVGTSSVADASTEPLTDVTTPVPGFSGRAAIAVLPFVNISDDPEQEYLADGFTEDILTGLQAYKSFPVIARTSTFTYKGKAQDIRQIAEELGAGYILEGSLRRLGDKVRITGQLNDATGNHIWAERYDVAWNEIITLQDTITANIILAIEPEILNSETERVQRRQTDDMEAWDLYLHARSDAAAPLSFSTMTGAPVTLEGSDRARQFALRAVEKDPTFAAAWTLLTHIEGTVAFNFRFQIPPDEAARAIDLAFSYAETARIHSPFEPTTCSCQALLFLMKGELEEALLLQEEAVLVNPSSAVVHAALSKILQVQGDLEPALYEINLAMRLSPKDLGMSYFLTFKAAILQAMGDFSGAERLAARAVLLAPDNIDARVILLVAKFAGNDMDGARNVIGEIYERVANWTPDNPYTEAFPKTVVAAASQEMRVTLAGASFEEGIQIIVDALKGDASI